jgi:hypothetical protein
MRMEGRPRCCVAARSPAGGRAARSPAAAGGSDPSGWQYLAWSRGSGDWFAAGAVLRFMSQI